MGGGRGGIWSAGGGEGGYGQLVGGGGIWSLFAIARRSPWVGGYMHYFLAQTHRHICFRFLRPSSIERWPQKLMFCHKGGHKNSCSVTEVATKTHVLSQRWPQKLMFCHRGGHKNLFSVTEMATKTHVLSQRWPQKLMLYNI